MKWDVAVYLCVRICIGLLYICMYICRRVCVCMFVGGYEYTLRCAWATPWSQLPPAWMNCDVVVYLCVHVCICVLYMRMYTCRSVCVCIYVGGYKYTQIHVCEHPFEADCQQHGWNEVWRFMYTCMYVYTYCIYVCRYVCWCLCMFVWSYKHISICEWGHPLEANCHQH